MIFGYYDDESVNTITYIVNPSTATIEGLLKVPFIDSSLAQAVVENRSLSGPYRNIVDFQKRLNLSGETLAQLMYYLQF